MLKIKYEKETWQFSAKHPIFLGELMIVYFLPEQLNYKTLNTPLKPRFITLLSILLLFTQCQRELSSEGLPVPVSHAGPDPITVTLQGNIVDENNLPAAGATVLAGTISAITNDKGYFRMPQVLLDKKTSLVTVTKAGYFKGIRSFAATRGTNQVNIKLIKKVIAGTFTAASGGTATLDNGATIVLPAGSVVLASSGADYTGNVKVFASYIDPLSADISQKVPGSFTGKNKDDKIVSLQSFGMMAVEMEGGTGEKLQIKNGLPATVTMPVILPVNAPANMPLWYMNEETGLWQEEGVAVKTGDNYVGQVNHFSFWNYDYPFDAVLLDLTVKTSKGFPVVHATVKISALNFTSDRSTAANGVTDSMGVVKGYVPAKSRLTVSVLDECGNSIYTQNVEPLSANTSLGSITIPSTAPNIVTLNGNLLNCTNNAVANGYAIITAGNTVRYASTNASGQYSVTFIDCSGSAAVATVIGVDASANQQAGKTVTLVKPVTETGTITTCGISAEQFIKFKVDGIEYGISTNTNDSMKVYKDTGGLYVYAYTPDYKTQLQFRFSGEQAGTFPIKEFSIFAGGKSGRTIVPPFNTVLTNYPAAIGQFYEGTLNGKFINDTTNIQSTFSGSYRLRRTN